MTRSFLRSVAPLVAAVLLAPSLAGPAFAASDPDLPLRLTYAAQMMHAVLAKELPQETKDSLVRSIFEEYLRAGEPLGEALSAPEKGRPVTLRRLYEAPGIFSIALVIRQPGAPATIHDHGVWMLSAVLAGEEKETLYELYGASDEGFVSLEYRNTHRIRPGSPVARLEAGTVHKVENPGRVPSISIQIIGNEMTAASGWVYDPGLRTREPAENGHEE